LEEVRNILHVYRISDIISTVILVWLYVDIIDLFSVHNLAKFEIGVQIYDVFNPCVHEAFWFLFWCDVSSQVTAILGKDFPFSIEAEKVDRKFFIKNRWMIVL
jgi:hypothetical protein